MDGLMAEVGDAGRFQLLACGILRLSVAPFAGSMLMMSFAGVVPDFWCLPPSLNTSVPPQDNVTRPGGSRENVTWSGWPRDNSTLAACHVPGSGQACDAHLVFDQSMSTVVNEWSLVCELEYTRALMTTLQMVGVLLGAFAAGQLADTLGRRSTVYGCQFLHVAACLVAAFSQSWPMFLAMRVATGVTIGVFLVSSFPFPMEFIRPQYRQWVAGFPAWTLGLLVFALLSYLLEDWSHLHIAIAALTLPCALTVFIVPESPRWLTVKGRVAEAEVVMKRIAHVNGRAVPADLGARLTAVAEAEAERQRAAGERKVYTYLDVYRTRRLLLTSLLLHAVWFSCSFSYYGISFGVKALSGDLYLNMFLMAIVEIPPNLSTIYLANKLGRRWTCLIFFLVASLASFAILVVSKTVPEDDQGGVTTGLALVSKLSVGAAWLACQTFTAELYPTVIRNLGYGASNTVSRIGGALAPLLLNMDTDDDVVRGYIVVGALMAASGAACLLLRETNGQELQDALETHGPAKEKGQGGNETGSHLATRNGIDNQGFKSNQGGSFSQL